jgi:hypothetical protein
MAGEGECKPCPRNSYSDKLASTSCDCEINFYRPFGTDIDGACIPVVTSTNQTSLSSNAVSQAGDKNNDPSTLQINREIVFFLGAILIFILICGFIIVVYVHQRSLPKNKHQSDLDVLEHYKQGNINCLSSLIYNNYFIFRFTNTRLRSFWSNQWDLSRLSK